MATVECRSIQKVYGSLEVMSDFNLRVEDHEFVVFLGPSGCGKSTMLRMIAGLEDISGGDLLIGGKRMNDYDPGDRGIAMVFQNYALYPHMTARENIVFGLERAGVAKAAIDERLAPVVESLGLSAYLSRKPTELSGGQQQRVAIARAMIKTPEVFLFDEPLSNLDAKLRGNLRVEIDRLHRHLKTTSVYVTHDQLEAMTLANRIVLMKEGRIEQMGTPEEIYQTPATLFAAGFIGTPNMNFLKLQASDGVLADTSIKLVAPFTVKPGPVTVGIRPGAIRLNEAGGAVRGMVERNEFHGETRLITVRTANNEINVAVAASTRVREGQSIGIDVDSHDLHLFDATTERRLK
ncbi:ABC transporter ATP-binding protein (plasmid) [Agrobacterium radiobacter]|uniref:Putative sugar transporter subunit: ATP-binding component of ABC superfamily transporter n=1 Tax=Agrobacterium tumefaciens str. B6 TaxID=1183423 RepID=A0A822V6Z1_AGRTU|nr:sn-glycerol-3-phosphate ABC transporter ATP-binding protein UgpC [Agrobacterium tumefaciens]MQB27822.1 sn-glycerol-3-phosphate ABC transporter ATP-binding protein UgpC [Agrobacterium tumefaciens]NTA08404.1 sn-glycerol-3-phosphate ABC transporter ATP-binding protein UgpC [Agrobacterium tumefaciens]NTB16226.1 sn-glycerol-3-phosphate ABC transporter ATP-binding protein UgpC [Agrobacterium tumefaciens]CVI25270.1 putative sugar transporter subunit: ATP-binding component of ABC superfamily transpo